MGNIAIRPSISKGRVHVARTLRLVLCEPISDIWVHGGADNQYRRGHITRYIMSAITVPQSVGHVVSVGIRCQ